MNIVYNIQMTTIQRNPIRDQIYDHLVAGILDRSFPPGSPIRDTHVASILDVSRTPVREALLRLSSDGLVDNIPGRGFIVRELSLQDVREAYPILSNLESLSISLAEKLPESVLKKLESLNKQMASKTASSSRLTQIDSEFHDTLVSSCPNVMLIQTIKRLRQIVKRYELAFMDNKELVEVSTREHEAIIESLRSGKLSKAQKLLAQQWRRSMDFVTKAVEQKQKEA